MAQSMNVSETTKKTSKTLPSDHDRYAALLYLPSKKKKGTKSQEEVEKIFSNLLVELDW